MTRVPFNWKRFWCPRIGHINCGDEGYLYDPESEYAMFHPSDVVPFEKISETKCLVLLGEPGIGKTTAVEKEINALKERVTDDKILHFHLGEFGNEERLFKIVFEDIAFVNWRNGAHNLHLFLDSLDECLIRIDVSAKLIENALQRSPIERLFLRIICRTADWPNSLENSLGNLWGDDFVGVYELAPLRRKDVHEAASIELGDADAFMKVVAERNVVPFAIKPVTLKMLLNIFKNDNALPSAQADIYERGCRSLCDESNESRRDSKDRRIRGNLDADERMLVAMRIAAATVFSNRYAVWTGPDHGDIPKEDITISEFLGKEALEGLNIDIRNEVISETLSTGLFTSRGANRMGFAHHTYAEFLAAWYLLRHEMAMKQISSLIVHPGDPEGRIVPQLYGVASWLAEANIETFKMILENDPEILLRCDLSLIEDKHKEELIERLLNLHERRLLLEYDFDNHTLLHQRLKNQLGKFIFDKSRAENVRNASMDIVRACNLQTLLPELAELALDQTEPIGVRVHAAAVLCRCGDKDIKSKLKPLALGAAGDDSNDELKGIGLKAVWPESITAEELFSVLTSPQNEHLIGLYHVFIDRGIAENLKTDDLPVALKWVESQLPNHHAMSRFSDLIDAIMLKAWNNLEHPGVLKSFAEATFARLKNHDGIVGRHAAPDFGEELKIHNNRRRNVLNEIIPIITAERNCFWLVWGSTPILSGTDLTWLRDKFIDETDNNQKAIIAQMMRTVFNPMECEHQNIIFDIYKTDPILESLFSPFFYVELNTPLADEMKKNHYEMKMFEEDRKAPPLTPPPRERIAAILNECETGNIKAWWALKREMTLEPNSTYYDDVIESEMTDLPGWKTSDDNIKERILNSAKLYLQDCSPESVKWLYQDKYYYPALAGYWALRLLLQCEPSYLEALKEDIWKKWVSSVVAYPACNGPLAYGDNHKVLLSRTYKEAPGEFIDILMNLIDTENGKFEHIFIIRKTDICLDERLTKALIEKIEAGKLKPNCMNNILETLLRNRAAGARESAVKIISTNKNLPQEEKMRTIHAAASLMLYSEDAGWEIVWPLIQEDENVGKSIITNIASVHNEEHTKRFLVNLPEEYISMLYLWIVKKYPYEEDPDEQGAHAVSHREQIGMLRDSLLNNLVARGTEKSCKELQRLSNELPSYDWLNRLVFKAQRIARIQTWLPPKPADIIRIAESEQSRLVSNGEQLLDILIESLERLEQKLQGETPAMRDLWNEKGQYTPKDENALSDYVKRHLDNDLKGVIVNREVEIRNNMGGQPGELTDIHVDAIIHGKEHEVLEKIKAIIEVKGCWHQEIETAMETQLVNRYLKDNQCNNGLYLIGWFMCSQWDEADYRKNNVPKMDIENARKQFALQAISLSKDGLIIKAFILNAALR
ncbi:MAG TPA: hypothetical protein PKH33_13560 [bacterium]|nr:hypothetical protein [bacterium]